MAIQSLRIRAFAFVASVAVLAFSNLTSADPPSRVARVGYMTGNVSFSPAGENDWIRASINRPLTTGDRLWVDSRARAEVQIGGAVVRMSSNTSLSILNLDDRIAQLRLSQGTLNVRVRRLDRNQIFEVATPNLAFTLVQPGEYRISVDPEGYATDIFVRRGQGEAYGDGAAYIIDSRQGYSFAGTGLSDYEYVNLPRPDDFDRWSSDRDRRFDNSPSARYVSQDVIGYEDLDANGDWRVDETYGSVWFPNRVSVGWAPYRDGHWAWVDPWGWTWIDDQPWGFAVSHYGRWTNLRGTWGWVPGPVRERAYYAPALVAFVGGNNFQLSISSGNVGGIGWFPLAPREVYRPSYAVSRSYFQNVNISNTVINNTVINNYYNNSNVTNIVYANRSVPGAVVAVPTTAFVQSQSVARMVVPLSRDVLVSAPVMTAPSAAPTPQSVRGAAVQGSTPPPSMFDRAVVARSAPPPAAVGFAAQQQQLVAQPGRPLDAAARRDLRPVAAGPAPVVNVVAPAQMAPPTVLPPRVAPAAGAGDGRGRSDDRRGPGARGESVAPVPVAPPQFAPSAPATQPLDQRGRGEKQRGQPVASPQNATPPPVAPPQFAPPPAAQPPEQRGRPSDQGERGAPQRGQLSSPSQNAAPVPVPPPQFAPPVELRGRGEQQRAQSVAPPPGAAPAPVAPPRFAPPVAEAQPTEQRGRPTEQRGRGEQQRAQSVAPPQSEAPPPVAPPQYAPPAPAAQPAEQRGRPTEQRGRGEQQRVQPMAVPPPPQPVPGAVAPAQEPKPVASKPKDKKKDGEDEKRDDEKRTQKE